MFHWTWNRIGKKAHQLNWILSQQIDDAMWRRTRRCVAANEFCLTKLLYTYRRHENRIWFGRRGMESPRTASQSNIARMDDFIFIEISLWAAWDNIKRPHHFWMHSRSDKFYERILYISSSRDVGSIYGARTCIRFPTPDSDSTER